MKVYMLGKANNQENHDSKTPKPLTKFCDIWWKQVAVKIGTVTIWLVSENFAIFSTVNTNPQVRQAIPGERIFPWILKNRSRRFSWGLNIYICYSADRTYFTNYSLQYTSFTNMCYLADRMYFINCSLWYVL